MFRSYRIGSLFGVPIKLDVTFLLVLPIFAAVIGVQIGETVELLNAIPTLDIAAEPLTVGVTPWLLGFVVAIGLFVGVVFHELGHSLVAIRYGYEIDSITLWIFGGLANLIDQPDDWRHEFWIAIVGPIVSVGVGLVSYGLVLATPPGLDAAEFVFGFLAAMNVGLAIFNMVPAFPMDGGRVLRALLARSRPYATATRKATEVGKFFAVLMGLIGLVAFNVILIGIAFFVYIAAASESRRAVVETALEDVPVQQLMTPAEHLDVVAPDASVDVLVDRMFRERHTGYPVVDGDELVGIVTLEDVQAIDLDEHDRHTVDEIMTEDVRTVSLASDANEAFTELTNNDVGRVLVTDESGQLRGLVSRTDLMTALEVLQKSDAMTLDEIVAPSNSEERRRVRPPER